MNIGIVGLGLIGASMAKAIKRSGYYRLFGYDLDSDVISQAISDNTIDKAGEVEDIECLDMLFLALYPRTASNL